MFKTVEAAKKTILDGHFECKKAMEIGDFKTNNRIILKRINPAFEYIKENDGLSSLIDFLTHDEIDLRISTARSLLPYYEEIAKHALNDIVEKQIPHKNYIARIILDEWNTNPW